MTCSLGRLRGLPRSKYDALAVALRDPTLLAAESDKEASKQAFRATGGAFVPSVSLEGRATHSVDADTFIGKRDDIAGKLVVAWDIFRGGQDSWRRAEMAERYTEETMRQARLQRDALEAIDKAWAARTITLGRISALTRQLAADKKTIAIYRKEYEIRQRSLIDLLNAENQYFNAAAALTSARGVVVFCRLSAAGGHGLPARLPQDCSTGRRRTARHDSAWPIAGQISAVPDLAGDLCRPSLYGIQALVRCQLAERCRHREFSAGRNF